MAIETARKRDRVRPAVETFAAVFLAVSVYSLVICALFLVEIARGRVDDQHPRGAVGLWVALVIIAGIACTSAFAWWRLRRRGLPRFRVRAIVAVLALAWLVAVITGGFWLAIVGGVIIAALAVGAVALVPSRSI